MLTLSLNDVESDGVSAIIHLVLSLVVFPDRLSVNPTESVGDSISAHVVSLVETLSLKLVESLALSITPPILKTISYFLILKLLF